MEVCCPVHTGLKKNPQNITVYVVFCWMPCGWTGRQFNCYWSHISSKCPPDKPHWCCVSNAGEGRAKNKAHFHASRGKGDLFFFLVKSALFVPQPPELCNYDGVVNHSHYTKLVCGGRLWLGRDEPDPLSVTGSPVSYQTDVIYPLARPHSPVRWF